MTEQRVGLIGLGNIGLPIAARLAEAGVALRVFDAHPSAAARDRLVSAGADFASDLRDLATDCDVVITVLPDSRIVEAVLLSPQFLDAVPDGCLIIEMSSGFPPDTRRIAARLATYGVRLVDAPICNGGVGGAEAGTMTVMLGGDDADVRLAAGVLAPTATTIRHAGSIGAGQTIKLLSNLLANAIPAMVAEAFAIGAASGFSRDQVAELLSVCAATNTLDLAAHVPAAGVDTAAPGGFRTELAAKDLRYVAAYAGELGVPHVFADAGHEFFLGAGNSGFSDAEARLSGWAWLVEPREPRG